jgi:hypothetical protein
MVPLSERRHRLYDSEIPEVILGLNLRLKQLLDEKKDAEEAETAYRCMHRLLGNNKGRPKYLKFDWDMLSNIIDLGEEQLMARLDEMKKKSTNAKSQ